MRILAVLAALIVPLAFYYPIYQQRDKAVLQADEEILELDRQIEQAKTAQRKLPQFREEVQRLNVELVKLRVILPPEPGLDEIRRVVDATAVESGVHVERFQPKQTIKREYLEIPIDTAIVGTIENMEAFFERLANRSRIIDADFVTLTKEPSGQWRAKFLMSTFALP